jgi:fatty-acyl-CoA synthase
MPALGMIAASARTCGYLIPATSPPSIRWHHADHRPCKDVIKSGGEWISSIDIENIAMGADGVANAAVIGVLHPKWDERPLLIIQPKPGAQPTKEAVLKYLEGKIAKWWTPDDVQFVEAIPLGATGKINKLALREQFKDYKLPSTQAAE